MYGHATLPALLLLLSAYFLGHSPSNPPISNNMFSEMFDEMFDAMEQDDTDVLPFTKRYESHGAGKLVRMFDVMLSEIFDAIKQDYGDVLLFAKGYESHGGGQIGRMFDRTIQQISTLSSRHMRIALSNQKGRLPRKMTKTFATSLKRNSFRAVFGHLRDVNEVLDEVNKDIQFRFNYLPNKVIFKALRANRFGNADSQCFRETLRAIRLPVWLLGAESSNFLPPRFPSIPGTIPSRSPSVQGILETPPPPFRYEP